MHTTLFSVNGPAYGTEITLALRAPSQSPKLASHWSIVYANGITQTSMLNLRSLLSAAYRHDHSALIEFLRFGTVGAGGLCVDTAFVYTMRASIGLYAAGMVGYFAAASVNWALNRAWTFRYRRHVQAHVQWTRFLAVNLVGLSLNRGMYMFLIATEATARQQPILAVAAGAAVGFGVNFILSRSLVFC